MRKGLLGSIAALAAGAGAAWGQQPIEPGGPPVGVPAPGGVPGGDGVSGSAGFARPPVIMPPGNYGPPGDPLGIGPVGGFGPPPGPMYPMPGPYAAQSYQPAPGGATGLGYGNAPHWWFEGEYLLWFTKGQEPKFPLVTTSAPSDGGVPGAASTTVLAGTNDLGYGAISGFRLTGGFFGDADRRFGFQMSGFMTAKAGNNQNFGSLSNTAGIPVFARPFSDVAGAQSAVVVSGPNLGPATVRVGTYTQTFGLEPVGVWNIYRAQPGTRAFWSLDFLAGYKFLEVEEQLFVRTNTMFDSRIALPVFTTGPFGIITQSVTLQPAQTAFGAPAVGGTNVGGPALLTIRDDFRTRNQFNGGVVGLRAEGRYGIFTTSFTGKLSFGNMHERIEVLGSSSYSDPSGRSGSVVTNSATFNNQAFSSGAGGGTGAAFGGVLANGNNIGTFARDRFTVISEVGLNVGVALTGGLTGYVGVSALYFPDVVRPGNVITTRVSSAAIPISSNYGAAGAPRSNPIQFNETDFWIGGVNFGLMLRY